MKRFAVMVVVLAMMLSVGSLAGCGNVYLGGEAMKASEISTLDAYGALRRVEPCPDCVAVGLVTTQPSVDPWVKEYLRENFCQWRFFVRAAKKDLTWGPKLEGE